MKPIPRDPLLRAQILLDAQKLVKEEAERLDKLGNLDAALRAVRTMDVLNPLCQRYIDQAEKKTGARRS